MPVHAGCLALALLAAPAFLTQKTGERDHW
jgi:hypothetical protein